MSDVIVFAVSSRDWKGQKVKLFDHIISLPGCSLVPLDEKYGKIYLCSFNQSQKIYANIFKLSTFNPLHFCSITF